MTKRDAATGFDLSGLNVLVIGAELGIGRAVAWACAKQGANLTLADLAAPDALAAEIAAAHGSSVSAKAVDVTDRAAVEALSAALDASGTSPDCLALTAGVIKYGKWLEQDPDDWEQDFRDLSDINVKGPINVARAFLPGMQARGWGRFVLCGSIAGRMGGLMAEPHYAASKGAVHALTRWLSLRYAKDGVSVNAVAPGAVATRMTEGMDIDPARVPLGRKLTPDEIAWPITYLLSPAASGMVGAVMDVNGGVIFS